MTMLDGRFVVFRAVYDRPTTYQHWQLRDLVHCDPSSSSGHVYCVYNTEIIKYNLQRNSTVIWKDLANWEPTSMTVGEGYMAAGGDGSQLFVARLSDGRALYNRRVGGTVNNSLHIAPNDATGNPTLYVCNNDCTIKVYDIRTHQLNQAGLIHCSVPINYVATSIPEPTNVVAVGDGKEVFLYRKRPSGYERVGTLKDLEGPCMSCAWNTSGTCFAVASQEGRVSVWDHRTHKVVSTFRTTDACRSVKFTCAPVDLLVFAEARRQVHVVDARCYTTRQTCGVSPAGPVDISGVACAPTGSAVYVGTDEGLSVFDVNIQARRAFLHADCI